VYAVVFLAVALYLAKGRGLPMWPIGLWSLLLGTSLGTLSTFLYPAVLRQFSMAEMGRLRQELARPGGAAAARALPGEPRVWWVFLVSHFGSVGVLLGTIRPDPSPLSLVLIGLRFCVSGGVVCWILSDSLPFSYKRSPSLFRSFFVRFLVAMWLNAQFSILLGLLFEGYALLGAFAVSLFYLLFMLFGLAMYFGFVLLRQLVLRLGLFDERTPIREAAALEPLQPEGIPLLPVDWPVIKGAVVGGLVGFFLGNHLADVTGLEVWPTSLGCLVAGLPVGAIAAAVCRAYRIEGFGFSVLCTLLTAFAVLGVYRLARLDDWSHVRWFGLVLVGANVEGLAAMIGIALVYKVVARGPQNAQIRASGLRSLATLCCFAAGFVSMLAAALAAGEVGSQLGGQVGRGIGETLGAFVGFAVTVIPGVVCFRHGFAEVGLNLRIAWQRLGFLVIGLANATVVWLLLR
jgi:hypothetical protein